MMNENSPIWARLIPAWTAVRVPLPARKAPTVTPSTFPPMTRAVKTSTGNQFATMIAGSISIPTETKKMAANRSRIGRTRLATAASSPDSPTSEPAMNAPSATE